MWIQTLQVASRTATQQTAASWHWLVLICVFQSLGFAKQQTAVYHDSSEAEVIALVAGLRLEGIPSAVMRGQVLDVLYPTKQTPFNPQVQQTDSNDVITNALLNAAYVPPMLPGPSGRAKLQILEDHDAVIKMAIKRRSPAPRHVVRTHRVYVGWLFELIDGFTSILIRHDKTLEQIAGFLNTCQFTTQPFAHICTSAHIGFMPFFT